MHAPVIEVKVQTIKNTDLYDSCMHRDRLSIYEWVSILPAFTLRIIVIAVSILRIMRSKLSQYEKDITKCIYMHAQISSNDCHFHRWIKFCFNRMAQKFWNNVKPVGYCTLETDLIWIYLSLSFIFHTKNCSITLNFSSYNLYLPERYGI